MILEILGAAAQTPLGDLDQTIARIGSGAGVGVGVGDQGQGKPRPGSRDSISKTERLLGRLPALALEVARGVAIPAGERTGVFLATGGLRVHWDELTPAMAEQRADAEASWARGLRRLHPLWMLRYLSNGAQAAIAHELGLLGDGATFAGAASAASALIAAAEAIDAGAIDHALVVAIDDQTFEEVAVELAARHPGLVPAAGVAALAVARLGPRGGVTGPRIAVAAADGIDPDHAEPSPAAITAVRARLPGADRELDLTARLGWLGAASALVGAAIASRCLGTASAPPELDLARAVTCTVAASPGQIGVIRVEALS